MSQMISLEQATWAWIEAGPRKHQMPVGKRFVKGIMAGFLLSTGGMLVQIMSASPWFATNAPGLLKIIQGAVFPVGLVMIVLLQGDLVTGEMAVFIMSTVKRRVPYWAFLYGWTITFVGNLVGALFYAAFLVHFSELYTPAMERGAANGADLKVSAINFRELWLRAIGCNVLVCIAVFQASLAKDVVSKVVASWFPIFVFVAAGFEHVVANMFLINAALMTKLTNFSVGEYIWKSIIASFIGNIIGAALLALPLVYLHGGDEFDPNQGVRAELPMHAKPGEMSSGASVNNITLQATPTGKEPWAKDVESQVGRA
ncbi:related to formate/nitrite transporter [Sporisorium reilianum f. sp. reilianum]|uniref:Related to formate/nitrite transporter n=1 Tax=Sporisorium reilianum f. sp. reilianum TaxID=72559 RepID=A0A2N8U523_9BASI|nr:related to formate/nitrite transporter [Sporisorium reilianum f. sp. reilianum]